MSSRIDSLSAPRSLPLMGQTVALPCFFPSVSSVKTNLAPVDYVRVLRALQVPYFLISAYDVHVCPTKGRKISHNLVKEASNNGSLILLDSGGYESYWREDRSWSKQNFLKTVNRLKPPIAFTFDLRIETREPKWAARSVNKWLSEHQRVTTETSFVPLIHASKEVLSSVCREIAVRVNPIMIAVPERELGDGIISRMATVSQIRRALEGVQSNTPLHVLGTGNPRSLLLLTIAGADSFDGLEWCQTAIDTKTALLYHFQQLELFGCRCKFCLDAKLDYTQRVLAHNLLFYAEWIAHLQRSRSRRLLLEDASRLMGSGFVKHACRESALSSSPKVRA